jgi:hypothetical protein
MPTPFRLVNIYRNFEEMYWFYPRCEEVQAHSPPGVIGRALGTEREVSKQISYLHLTIYVAIECCYLDTNDTAINNGRP